jgi:hypothetical protein
MKELNKSKYLSSKFSVVMALSKISKIGYLEIKIFKCLSKSKF